MAKKSQAPVEFAVLQYYDHVRGLISDAGRYAHAFKLRENLNDSATRFKVEHVLQRYYDGDMRKLNDEIHFRRRQCLKAMSEINRLLERSNMIQVRDKDALADLLLDEGRRAEWKKLINKYQKNNQIIPLQYIELEYRKNRTTKEAP